MFEMPAELPDSRDVREHLRPLAVRIIMIYYSIYTIMIILCIFLRRDLYEYIALYK